MGSSRKKSTSCMLMDRKVDKSRGWFRLNQEASGRHKKHLITTPKEQYGYLKPRRCYPLDDGDVARSSPSRLQSLHPVANGYRQSPYLIAIWWDQHELNRTNHVEATMRASKRAC